MLHKILARKILKKEYLKYKNVSNLNSLKNSSKTLRHLSVANVYLQYKPSDERLLPKIFFFQNPAVWLFNKIDYKILRGAWDPEFDEEEFKRGTKKAISVICTLISLNLWDNLRGLITRQTLSRIKRDFEIYWTDEHRRNINIEPSDIKLALTKKIHFLKIEDQKFVDVDMLFMAMKFKEEYPSENTDMVVIKMIARFHRNYSVGQVPNWTVSLFKVTGMVVHPTKKTTRSLI